MQIIKSSRHVSKTLVSGADVAIIRPLKGRIKVVIPYQEPKYANRAWIKGVCGKQTHPEWNSTDKTWDISRSWFPVILDAMLRQYGPVHIYEDHSEIELCNLNCQQAHGEECTCSCGGIYHGWERADNARHNWILLSEDTQQLLGVSSISRYHWIHPVGSFVSIHGVPGTGVR
jgi:hypothetical protein